MITFLRYINENINKVDFFNIEKDDNFLIGCELEWIQNNDIITRNTDGGLKYDIKESEYIDSLRNISNVVTDRYKTFFFNFLKNRVGSINLESDSWKFVYDYSLYNSFGIEIVMPPFSFKDICVIVPTIFDFIKKYGYTDDNCGIHVSISHKLLDHKNFSHSKMALMSDDGHVYKKMPSRKDNFSSIPSNKYLKSFGSIDSTNKGQSINDRYYAKNVKYNDRIKAVEYRLLGGKGYENEWSFIRKLMLEQMFYYKKSFENINYINKKELKLKYKDKVSSEISNKIYKDEDVYNIDFDNFIFGRGCKNLISLLRRVSYIKNDDIKKYFYYNLFNMKNFSYTLEYLRNYITSIDDKYINILIDVLNKKKNLSNMDLLMIHELSLFVINLIKNKKSDEINVDNFNNLLKNILSSNIFLNVHILRYYKDNIDHFRDVKLKPK
ncbi:MAG TPA: hypothetical protein PLD95_04070 [bacterium]|jgi:hypothetical protein|nr:hypothetical protein [bacterium]